MVVVELVGILLCECVLMFVKMVMITVLTVLMTKTRDVKWAHSNFFNLPSPHSDD